MAERKSFLLRMDRELLDAVQRWANDDLRSLNGQLEFLVRRALRDAGRAPAARTASSPEALGSTAAEDPAPSTSSSHDAPSSS